jgi:hypothetical protein
MTDECYLTTVREFGTVEAFGPDFARQLHLIYLAETKFLEESGLIGQAENSGYAKRFRFFKAGIDKQGAYALPLAFFGHGYGLDFRQVKPDDVHRCAGKHTLILAVDKIVANVLVDITQRAWQHLISISKVVDELVDLGYVLDFSFFYRAQFTVFLSAFAPVSYRKNLRGGCAGTVFGTGCFLP